jgi:hypothetical protein
MRVGVAEPIGANWERAGALRRKIAGMLNARRHEIWLFFVAAGITFMIGTLVPVTMKVQNGFETLNSARALALTGTLADPFAAGQTGPTAHVAPVFPLIAALLLRFPVPWQTSLFFLSMVLSGFNAALLPRISQSLFFDRRPGFYAGILSAFCVPALPQHDLLISLFLCLWGCALILEHSRCSWIVSGLAALCNPITFIPMLVFSAYSGRRAIFTTLAGVGLFCLPWIARNYLELGSPAPIRDNFGLELAVSNNDCALATLIGNIVSGCFERVHPNFSETEVTRLQSYGEIRYNQLRFRESIEWIKTHPGRFLRLTLGRLEDYLFPNVREDPRSLFTWPVTALVLLGFAAGRISLFGPLQFCALGVWLPYLLVQSDIRYRAMGMWAWLLLAGFLIHFRDCRQGHAGAIENGSADPL